MPLFVVIRTVPFHVGETLVKSFFSRDEAVAFVKKDMDRKAEESEKIYGLPSGSLLKQHTRDYEYCRFGPHEQDEETCEQMEWRIVEEKTPVLESIDVVNAEDPWEEGGSWSIVCAEEKRLDDLSRNAVEAAQEYLNTFCGWRFYTWNNDCFDWSSFDHVPDSICREHGFSVLPISGTQTVCESGCLSPEPFVFEELLEGLPKSMKGMRSSSDILWTDGGSVFCETEEAANAVMEWLSALCVDCAEEGAIPVKALGEENENGLCPWTVTLRESASDEA